MLYISKKTNTCPVGWFVPASKCITINGYEWESGFIYFKPTSNHLKAKVRGISGDSREISSRKNLPGNPRLPYTWSNKRTGYPPSTRYALGIRCIIEGFQLELHDFITIFILLTQLSVMLHLHPYHTEFVKDEKYLRTIHPLKCTTLLEFN